MNCQRIYPSSINQRFIDEAVKALRDGEIIIYPTDTFYALGCSALDNRAIERLCRFKGINPQKESLSIVCASISQASEYARIDNRAFAMLRENLPGPFTFLLPAVSTLPKVFKGRRIVGIRVPDNPIATTLAETLGNPLLSTSITTGSDSGDTEIGASVIEAEFESCDEVALMIDGGDGRCLGSTVVDLTDSSDPIIVRQGLGQLT